MLITHRHPDHCDPVAVAELVGKDGALVSTAQNGMCTIPPGIRVRAGGRRIIHCGDTMWHGHWWQIGRQYGPFDAAFLPINGARFGWRKPVSDIPAVMTPEQAVAAAVVLGAQRLIPIHYGMAPSPEYTEVAHPEEALRSEGKRRGVRVQILQPGQRLKWD